jgi:P27 family predicted phage terminase small subunit
MGQKRTLKSWVAFIPSHKGKGLSAPNPVNKLLHNNMKVVKPIPQCPVTITGEAKAEWHRVCADLDSLGVLSTSDRSVIGLYCKAWERWAAAEAHITPSTLVIESPKTGTPMHNPYISIATKAHELILKLAAELGLTPRARTIMAKNAAIGKTPATEDDFSDLDAA